MVAYLIARENVDPLDTVVFAAGPNGKEEAVALFTDPNTAKSYIEAAGWEDEYTVATVEPIPFLRWLLHAYDDGVHHLVVDPDFADQEAQVRLNTLDLEAHLAHAGEHIVEVARPDF